jgi:uncharacterized membrane protein YidH (DUF202 family)
MEKESPYDPGLQPERTLLAWRRTCLALVVGSAVIVRFAGESIGYAAAAIGIAGVSTAAAGYFRAAVRYRLAHEGLTRDGQLPIDGLALAMMALTLLLIGIGAAAYVIGVGALRLNT